MHALVAQMALSANVRMDRKQLRETTIQEIETLINAEDETPLQIDGKFQKLFDRRGTNPIRMTKVIERTEQK